MTTGSCLCGTVRWRVDGAFGVMSHCHCSMCRKAHGAPFATYTSARKADFRWEQGETEITTYESSPEFPRAFCSHCGSVVPTPGSGDPVDMPAGVLDGDPGVRPSLHIFFASKAPWLEVGDDLPRHAAYPADAGLPAVTRPDPGLATSGVVRGSCLCGDVAFEVTEPFSRVHNCHCSRCRKARAAAHTSNGFTSLAGVRFTRGADRVRLFKLPDARHFTQAFCERCGSGMPRLDEARQIAVVPLGALDDPPSRPPMSHIHVASAAPWYTIADGLPCFDEAPS